MKYPSTKEVIFLEYRGEAPVLLRYLCKPSRKTWEAKDCDTLSCNSLTS